MEIEVDLQSVFQQLFPQQRISQGKAVCPFHSERMASFNFFRGADGKSRYYCFGCGVKGDVIDLVRAAAKQDGEEISTVQALKRLEDLTGKKLMSPKTQEAYYARELRQERLQAIYQYFNQILLTHPAAQSTRDWLIERGAPAETWGRMPIGAYPPLEEIKDWANKKKIPYEWIQEERLLIGAERNGMKWVGALAFFYGQSFGEISRIKLRPVRAKISDARFLGKEEIDIGFFGLSHYQPNNGDRPLIVEGEFDVLIPWAKAGGGPLNIFCRSGSACKTLSAMMTLKNLGMAAPILLGDNDKAGDEWARELARNCRQVGLEAEICVPLEYRPQEDPAELSGRLPDIRAFELAIMRGLRDPFAIREELSCPPLPSYARLPEDLGKDACSWLNEYIAFSRKWSPRGYDGFHEAVGVWVLSTIAARRVVCELGKEIYPSLYLLLIARTGVWAKTTTVKIALAILRQAGLDWLLAPSESTPQGFLRDLCGRLPPDYGDIEDEHIREREKMRVTLPGRRGWYYEEFGQHLSAMLKEGGFMADFRGILRKFDDHPPDHEYSTSSRGRERIEKPCLSLLGSLTPADFCEVEKKGPGLWNDGYLARFGLIAAPMDNEKEKQRFPLERRVIPASLISPLALWSQRLGVPVVHVFPALDGKGKETGRYRIQSEAELEEELIAADEVVEAFNCYDEGLHEISGRNQQIPIDGHYHRFSEKALRIALLFASFAGSPIIEMRHWARAQEIAERWRSYLHRLIGQLGEEIQVTRAEKIEERIRTVGLSLGNPTTREIKKYVRGTTTQEVQVCLDFLVRAGEIEKVEIQGQRGPKTTRYVFKIH